MIRKKPSVLFINPRRQQLFSMLKEYFSEKILQFRRIIFLYGVEEKEFEEGVVTKVLYSGSEIATDDLFSFLLKTPQFKIKGKAGNVTQMARFHEHEGRIIQKVALTFSSAVTFFKTVDVDDPTTCLVFYNLDRLCYRTSTFLLLDSLIRQLPSSCQYGFFTTNVFSPRFYEWVVNFLKRSLVYRTSTAGTKNVQDGLTFLELQEIMAAVEQSSELDILRGALTEEGKALKGEIWEWPLLLSDQTISIKEATIKHVRANTSLERAWENFRIFMLNLLLYLQVCESKSKQHITVISYQYGLIPWEDFLEKYEIELPSQIPEIRFLELAGMRKSDFTFDPSEVVIVDLGDEIVRESEDQLLDDFLHLAGLACQKTPTNRLIMVQPLLIKAEFYSTLMTRPPLPYRLGYFYEPEERQSEEEVLVVLYAGLNAQPKQVFFDAVATSWWSFPGMLTTQNPSSQEFVTKLRQCGLLDRRYYHTTALGRWFFHEDANILSYIRFLERENPHLFGEKPVPLSHLGPKEIEGLFLASITWFFETTKYRTYDVQYLHSFQNTLLDTWYLQPHTHDYATKTEALILKLIHQESPDRPHIDRYTKEISRYNLYDPEKKKRKSAVRGQVLNQVLADIVEWMDDFEKMPGKFSQEPYFHISRYAHEAAEESYKPIKKSLKKRPPYKKYIRAYVRAYVRTVTRLMNKSWIDYLAYLRHLRLVNWSTEHHEYETVIKDLRIRLRLSYIRLKSNRANVVLIFKEHEFFFQHSPFSSIYLQQTCKQCIYFETNRKRDCKFFNRATFVLRASDQVPGWLRDREEGIFPQKVACPIWRPKKPVTWRFPQTELFHCAICAQPLAHPPRWNRPVQCQCQAEYQWISRKSAKKGNFKFQMSPFHTINHDFRLFDPSLPEEGVVDIVAEDPLELIHPSQRSNFQVDTISLPVISDPSYVFIHETDVVYFNKKRNTLRLKSPIQRQTGFFKNQPIDRTYLLKDVRTIDTCQLHDDLVAALEGNPTIILRYRSTSLLLRRQDKATFIEQPPYVPILEVKYHRKRPIYTYPVPQLASVVNVGKPRLNQLLIHWGVKVSYRSTKGVKKETATIIEDALALPGVKPVLQEMHLMGLILSVLNATAHLIGMAEAHNQSLLGNRISLQTKQWLFWNVPRLFTFYRAFPYKSLTLINAFEGRVFRPFATGFRTFVKKIQGQQNELLLPLSIGRTVTRRLKKKTKHDYLDYLGGYTPLDAALNCTHRGLRRPLRLMNAKTDLGYDAVPLFSHAAHDKPGKAAHLDLEEVGRIITRLVLSQEVVNRKLVGDQFELRYDDDYLAYYVPYGWTANQLRTQLVNDRIFPLTLTYHERPMSYREAHQHHVTHLCTSLEECVGIENTEERRSYLLQNYQPLIFNAITDLVRGKDELRDFLQIFLLLWGNKRKIPRKEPDNSLQSPTLVTDLITTVNL